MDSCACTHATSLSSREDSESQQCNVTTPSSSNLSPNSILCCAHGYVSWLRHSNALSSSPVPDFGCEKGHDDGHSKEWPLCEGIKPVVFCNGRASESAVRTRTGVGHLSKFSHKSKWMVSGSPSSDSRLAFDHR